MRTLLLVPFLSLSIACVATDDLDTSADELVIDGGSIGFPTPKCILTARRSDAVPVTAWSGNWRSENGTVMATFAAMPSGQVSATVNEAWNGRLLRSRDIGTVNSSSRAYLGERWTTLGGARVTGNALPKADDPSCVVLDFEVPPGAVADLDIHRVSFGGLQGFLALYSEGTVLTPFENQQRRLRYYRQDGNGVVYDMILHRVP